MEKECYCENGYECVMCEYKRTHHPELQLEVVKPYTNEDRLKDLEKEMVIINGILGI